MSILYVPLKLKGKMLGCIGVDRYRTRMEITRDDVESLTFFANSAESMIESTKLSKALNDEKLLSESVIRSSVNGAMVSACMGNIPNINSLTLEVLGLKERANELISIARPDVRGWLRDEVKK